MTALEHIGKAAEKVNKYAHAHGKSKASEEALTCLRRAYKLVQLNGGK